MPCIGKGRARYRPIDDRVRYWANFNFLDYVWEDELRIFSEETIENIIGIRTHTHSFKSPVQLPLAHRDTAEEVCLNHVFMIQLLLAFPFS